MPITIAMSSATYVGLAGSSGSTGTAGTIVIERASTPQELGPKLNRTAADVVRFLMQQGEMVTATQSLGDDGTTPTSGP